MANTFGSFALLAVMVMGGFILSRGEMSMQFILKKCMYLLVSGSFNFQVLTSKSDRTTYIFLHQLM